MGRSGDTPQDTNRSIVDCDIIRAEKLYRLEYAKHCQPGSHASGSQEQDDLDLFAQRHAQLPDQRYRDDQDDQVGDDGQRQGGEEDLALVDAVGILDRRIPVRPDREAGEYPQDLDGEVGQEETPYEDLDALGDSPFDGKDPRREEEDGGLGEEGGGNVDDGACVEPLGVSAEPR